MAARVIDGPEKDWLDVHDICHLLRMSESTLRRLIKDGKFPAPLATSQQGRFWCWEVVVWWRLNTVLGVGSVSQPPSTTSQPASSGRGDDFDA